MIGVFLDNNIWDLLFVNQLDLAVELPRDHFRVAVTREAEFEIEALEGRSPELKAFIDATIARYEIPTDAYFGFAEATSSQEEHRVAGWGFGRWMSNRERDFFETQRARRNQKMRPTKLYKHEADISLAARSFESVVVIRDRSGALRDASSQGGKVVFLAESDLKKQTLRQLIEKAAGV